MFSGPQTLDVTEIGLHPYMLHGCVFRVSLPIYLHFALFRRVYNVLMISLTCRRSWSKEKTMFFMIFACNFG